jgi:hypothetical protein
MSELLFCRNDYLFSSRSLRTPATITLRSATTVSTTAAALSTIATAAAALLASSATAAECSTIDLGCLALHFFELLFLICRQNSEGSCIALLASCFHLFTHPFKASTTTGSHFFKHFSTVVIGRFECVFDTLLLIRSQLQLFGNVLISQSTNPHELESDFIETLRLSFGQKLGQPFFGFFDKCGSLFTKLFKLRSAFIFRQTSPIDAGKEFARVHSEVFSQLSDKEEFVLAEFQFFLDRLGRNQSQFVDATTKTTAAARKSAATLSATTVLIAASLPATLITTSPLAVTLPLALLTAFTIGSVSPLSFFLSLGDCRQHHREGETDA